MKKNLLALSLVLTMSLVLMYCSMELQPKETCHQEMVGILKEIKKRSFNPKNNYNPEAKLPYMDSLLNVPHSTAGQIRFCNYLKANILMELGNEKEAIRILENLVKGNSRFDFPMQKVLAMAYLRQGERSNCVKNHAAESCILPIAGVGVHADPEGSRKAIRLYEAILQNFPDDLESRWLLNLAYMTVGEYPKHVPREYFIPGMEGDTTNRVVAFEDVAADLKLDIMNMAGGAIADDFDNDGYLDLMTSGWGNNEAMHFLKSDTKGSFVDQSSDTGLNGITGGLNIQQTDYNNDGFKDVFVLRGAWRGDYGREPNSLLRNNGDGTFTDVTTQSGLLSFHPTQTATWNDFNKDGWLDVFIGNETMDPTVTGRQHPCELYINNQDGTFREVAAKSNCNILSFVKGVTSGDYDNDGWPDLFISTMNGERRLLRNKGGDDVVFEDVTIAAKLTGERGRTFPTWFWDYNNDGWLDIFVCDYTFEKSLAYYAAAEKLGIQAGSPEKMILYRNNQDGTFTNVAGQLGLNTNVFAMGSNFGDIDNDGYLDMYLGSGNPLYQSLIPNKMFRNVGGEKFVDVTTSARVGHLQKGHAISFADMDNDGDQDIYAEMGGAYPGDAYQNSFFMNPGQNSNNWICLTLEGTQTNRAAIGARVVVTFSENGRKRSVYRDVNSGGSFGSSPLRREIGIGQADVIEKIEIHWPVSKKVQVFHDVSPNRFLKISEGSDVFTEMSLKKQNWILPNRICVPGTKVATVTY